MNADDNEERRAYIRWSVGSAVVVVLRDRLTKCRLKDISAGGAAVDVQLPEAIGEKTSLKTSQTRSIVSRIVSVTPHGSGLQFLIDEALKHDFTEYIINGINPSDW